MRSSPRQLDLLVVGLARSGTTLLANLLTNPAAHRVCLAEPRVTTRRAYRPEKQAYFRALGFPDPITTSTVAGHLLAQDRAGIKEVRARHITAAIGRFDPRRIVLVTRDARAALASYYEKNKGSEAPRKTFPARLFLRTAPVLLRLLERERHRLTVVRYETFVADEGERDRLAETLGWPLDGDLGIFDSMRRGGETGKHDHTVSTRSVGRPSPTDPVILAALTPALAGLTGYQRAFGYPVAWDERLEPGDLPVNIPA